MRGRCYGGVCEQGRRQGARAGGGCWGATGSERRSENEKKQERRKLHVHVSVGEARHVRPLAAQPVVRRTAHRRPVRRRRITSATTTTATTAAGPAAATNPAALAPALGWAPRRGRHGPGRGEPPNQEVSAPRAEAQRMPAARPALRPAVRPWPTPAAARSSPLAALSRRDEKVKEDGGETSMVQRVS